MRYDDYDDYSSRSSRGSSRRGSSSYSSGRDYDRDYYRDRDYRSDFGRDYDRGYYDRDRYSDRYSTRSSRDWYDDFDRSDWERTAPNWEDHGAARKKRPAGGSTRSSRPAPSGRSGSRSGSSKMHRRAKKTQQGLAVLLAAVMCCTLLSACGQPETTDPTEGTEGTQTETNAADLVYAVEAGSAGEAIAKEKGWQTNPVTAQADTLMEVSAGTSDAAIIDLLMAAAMTGEGTSYPDLTYDSQGLTTEEYGIGCRKGSDLAQYINNVLAEAYADGTMKEIATTYKLQDALVEQPAAEEFTPAADGDVAYIQDKGTLIVGITEFEPMDYKDENGQWIGFDADMAKVVAEKLGVEVQFVVIDWDNKIMELDSKNVDVLWNGMTLTDEVKNSMECTNPYFNNAQVVVTAGK